MLEVALLVAVFAVKSADLPQGAVLRLGDDRWRAGYGVRELVLSPDGKRFATSQRVGNGIISVKLWDSESGRVLRSNDINADLFVGLAWGTEGGFAVVRRVNRDRNGRGTLAPDDLRVWEFTDPLAMPPPLFPTVWSKWASQYQADIERPKSRGEFAMSPSGRRGPALSPDGKQLLRAIERGVSVLDTVTGKERGRLEGHAAELSVIAFSSNGQRIATVDEAGLIRLWDAATLRPLNVPQGHRSAVTFAQLSPDGKRLVTAVDGESVRVWDARTGKELRAFAAKVDGPRPTFTPDGLAVVFRETDRLLARDVLTGLERSLPGEMANHRAGGAVLSADGKAVSPNGRVVVESSWNNRVVVVEVATGQVRRSLVSHHDVIRVLGFTPDGTRLLTAGADHTVLVWDVRPQAMPLPVALKRETNAAKLWVTMCIGKADASWLAMARLAAEPAAAVATARMRMKPATESDPDDTKLMDSRAIELLESLRTPEAVAFLGELAGGDVFAWRTQEAKRALERLGK